VLGVKPSDLEWLWSSDSEAPTFPASVMSPLTTAGSTSIVARGLPGVVGRVSWTTLAASSKADRTRGDRREEVVVGAGAALPAGFEGDEGGGVDFARRTHRRCF
jgi:hypothetical protein